MLDELVQVDRLTARVLLHAEEVQTRDHGHVHVQRNRHQQARRRRGLVGEVVGGAAQVQDVDGAQREEPDCPEHR